MSGEVRGSLRDECVWAVQDMEARTVDPSVEEYVDAVLPILAARLAPVEALADEWDGTVYTLPPGYPMTVNEFCRYWFKAPLRAALAPKPAPEADPRCEATFPCHPTPEWPCDDPEMDHRCALPARHGRSGEDEGHRLTVHLMRPDGTMPTCRLNKGGGNFTARPEDATCPACAPQPAPGEEGSTCPGCTGDPAEHPADTMRWTPGEIGGAS